MRVSARSAGSAQKPAGPGHRRLYLIIRGLNPRIRTLIWFVPGRGVGNQVLLPVHPRGVLSTTVRSFPQIHTGQFPLLSVPLTVCEDGGWVVPDWHLRVLIRSTSLASRRFRRVVGLSCGWAGLNRLVDGKLLRMCKEEFVDTFLGYSVTDSSDGGSYGFLSVILRLQLWKSPIIQNPDNTYHFPNFSNWFIRFTQN